MNRIALLVDQAHMAAQIKEALMDAAIEADIFNSIAQAKPGFSEYPYAGWIIDCHLPDGDGLDLLRQLRADGRETPALILMTRDAVNDGIDAVEGSADDYLVKPFPMAEVVRRIRPLLRQHLHPQVLESDYLGLCVQTDAGRMRHQEKSVSLPPTEVQLMLTLMRACGKTVRRSTLEDAAWGKSEPVTPNALDVALHRLRRKLTAIDAPVQIMNTRGHGYGLAEKTPVSHN